MFLHLVYLYRALLRSTGVVCFYIWCIYIGPYWEAQDWVHTSLCNESFSSSSLLTFANKFKKEANCDIQLTSLLLLLFINITNSRDSNTESLDTWHVSSSRAEPVHSNAWCMFLFVKIRTQSHLTPHTSNNQSAARLILWIFDIFNVFSQLNIDAVWFTKVTLSTLNACRWIIFRVDLFCCLELYLRRLWLTNNWKTNRFTLNWASVSAFFSNISFFMCSLQSVNYY